VGCESDAKANVFVEKASTKSIATAHTQRPLHALHRRAKRGSERGPKQLPERESGDDKAGKDIGERHRKRAPAAGAAIAIGAKCTATPRVSIAGALVVATQKTVANQHALGATMRAAKEFEAVEVRIKSHDIQGKAFDGQRGVGEQRLGGESRLQSDAIERFALPN